MGATPAGEAKAAENGFGHVDARTRNWTLVIVSMRGRPSWSPPGHRPRPPIDSQAFAGMDVDDRDDKVFR